MKKIIFKNLLNEILIFFILSILTLTIIIWVVQAVNYLDIVTEDGHSFKVYFYYSILSIPKLLSRTFLFVFFLSIFYVIANYEEKGQLLIYWTHGVSKKEFVNKIIRFSIFFLIINVLISVLLVPYTLDKSRSFIRSSNLDFFPNLIKPKKFIDTVENLTIFIESKNINGSYRNIILKDNTDSTYSQIIIAESGRVLLENNQKLLILNNGQIIQSNAKSESKENSTSFFFVETKFDLEKYSTKTTKYPKIQELETFKLTQCANYLINNTKNKKNFENFSCNKDFLGDMTQELFKRIYIPIYIILLALIGSLLVVKSKNSHDYSSFKIKIFLTGILFLVISEVSLNFTGTNNIYNLIFLFFPIISFLLIYQILNYKLKVN